MSVIQAVVSVDKDGRVYVTGYAVHGFTASMLFNYASYLNVKHDGLERTIARTLEQLFSDRKVGAKQFKHIVYHFKDERIGSAIRGVYLWYKGTVVSNDCQVSTWDKFRSKFNDRLKFIFVDHPISLTASTEVFRNKDEHEDFLPDTHLVNARIKGGHN